MYLHASARAYMMILCVGCAWGQKAGIWPSARGLLLFFSFFSFVARLLSVTGRR